MKKILGLCFFPAFMPPTSGGELRLYHIYRELGRWYDVVLLTSSFQGEHEERVQHGSRFVERRLPKDHHFVSEWQKLAPLGGAGDISAICVGASARFDTPMMRAFLEEYDDADVIIHECPHTVDFDIFMGLDSKPRIYNSYNYESALVRELHPEAKSQPLHDLVDQWERRLLQEADLVAYCSALDLKGFEQLLSGPLERVIEIPNGAVSVSQKSRHQSTENAPIHAIFVASAHLPNVEAARHIAEVLAPKLPAIVFDIVGGCLPAGTYAPNVVRHGPVDARRKSELLIQAHIALNPMIGGSGSNLKMLEFFSYGLAVISTPFGARGYSVTNGENCIIAPLENFSDHLFTLAESSALRESIGRHAREFAEAQYSWPAIAQRLRDAIELLPEPKRGLLDKPFILGMNDYDPFTGNGGGSIRIKGLYDAVDRQQSVVYLCFGGDKLSVESFGTQSIVIKVPKTAEHRSAEAASSAEFWISVWDILALEYAPRNKAFSALYKILSSKAALVVFDHPYLVSLTKANNVRFVYSSQNYETELKRTMLAYHPKRDHYVGMVQRAENFAIEASSGIAVVAEAEGHAMMQGRHQSAPVVVVRNGAMYPAEVLPTDASVALEAISETDVVFVGSAHAPNIESVQFIFEHVAPKLPDTRFHILGSCVSASTSSPSNVRCWGSVSESLKTAVLRRCALAINPMFSGSGSNIKLADFIGHGLHVVSTPFGRRGYPAFVDPHVTVADADDFAEAIQRCLQMLPTLTAEAGRRDRQEIFARHLSMRSLGDKFAQFVSELQQPRRRILFVTYRWMFPIRGGGEASLLRHLEALAQTGRYSIDVVAPDVAVIRDEHRFSAQFDPVQNDSAPVDLPHVRFRRFPVQAASASTACQHAYSIWSKQPRFEQEVYRMLPTDAKQDAALAWGWTWPGAPGSGRWTLASFGIQLARPGKLALRGYIPYSGGITVRDGASRQLDEVNVSSDFFLEIDAEAGEVAFEISATRFEMADARPLGAYITQVTVDGQATLDLQSVQLTDQPVDGEPALQTFERLNAAAELAREGTTASMAMLRGPHSPDLEQFIEANVADFDLVVTHNSVFRTTNVAISEAKRSGTPVLVLPHAHLDDDFYHFPDDTRTTASADAVGAVPRAAGEFYRRQGAKRVAYITPGCDVDEQYTEEDEAAFRAVWPDSTPFILVLGRKAGAKRYRTIVSAVERLASKHAIKVVLIGPDDDHLPLESAHAHYLGLQPRAVVRGAIRACVTLANMSSSESFGMVLLEAWLAGKPVIANRNCAAFQDLAMHGRDALLVNDEEFGEALETILLRPSFARELGEAGRETARQFDWRIVNKRFVDLCDELVGSRVTRPA